MSKITVEAKSVASDDDETASYQVTVSVDDNPVYMVSVNTPAGLGEHVTAVNTAMIRYASLALRAS